MTSPAERLQIAIEALPRSTAPFAVLRIGMDDFGSLNESYGSLVGNQVLEIAEQRLASAVREHELVVRLPGDEFAVLLHSVQSVIRAGAAADRLNDLLCRTYMVGGEALEVTACVGIAVAPEDGDTAELLLGRAGAALACAKAAGIGTVQLFEPAMEAGRQKRHALSLDLRKAVLLQQFEVHFQPQVDAATHRLLGFEALLRWCHPDLGWIDPADFIPLAEDLGLMPTLGDFVLRAACAQARELPEHVTMGVNAAASQFKRGFFLDAVQAALFRHKLPPDRLEIEIGEDLLFKQETLVTAAVHGLHKTGVHLAMDGFGAGLSSLGQLARLPFRRVKLDRTLVGNSLRQRAMVRAITALSQGIGITPVAVGIETAAQLAQARMDGVGAVQGYLFGKPVPAAQLPALVEHLGREAVPIAAH